MPTRSLAVERSARAPARRRSRRSTDSGRKRSSRPPLRKMTRALRAGASRRCRAHSSSSSRGCADQPVHVVEQHEGGDRLLLAAEALGDGAGEGRHVVHEARLEAREALGLEIARDSSRASSSRSGRRSRSSCRAAAPPASRGPGSRAGRPAKPPRRSMHHAALRLRHAEKRHHRGAADQPQQALAEQPLAQLRAVDLELRPRACPRRAGARRHRARAARRCRIQRVSASATSPELPR